MWTKFELDLRPMPKKNSRGIFTNKKTGKSFLAENPNYKKFERAGKKMLKAQMKERGIEPFTTQLRARYRFEYERTHHIADICNLIVGLNDLVQEAGVFANDNLVKLIEHAEVVEGMRDRCTFWLAPLQASAQPMKKVGFDEAKALIQKISAQGNGGKI
jgi:Holliday junction resolvase RusA-like endonuclease